MLREAVIIDKVEVLATGHVQVRRATLVLRDEEELTRTYHRHVLAPGQSLDQEDPRVAAIARAAWDAGPAVLSPREG